ncbi:MAG: alpha-amylase, partial [Bacteroidales bacterium]|nr:alpha-amylase [Bacteroidales bacterium]
MQKPIIYQMLPRLWGNDNSQPVKNGTLTENGTGRFSDIDSATLEYIKWLGCTHVWYTGLLRHSTQACENGCTPSHPQFVKGKAGSPYAICDYYDVNAYLADDPENRMTEFES